MSEYEIIQCIKAHKCFTLKPKNHQNKEKSKQTNGEWKGQSKPSNHALCIDADRVILKKKHID